MPKGLEKVQIVVLAAGKGTRMLSDDPKALAPLKGKPFLGHILDTIAELSLPLPPVVVVGHQKEKIFDELGEAHTYAHQEEQLGTGHAVMSAKSTMHQDHEIVIVISADQPVISSATIQNIINTHQEKTPAITIATADLPDFEDWRAGLKNFGRIVRDEAEEVLKIVENKDATPEEKEITEVNPAIYAFDRDWLWKNIEEIKNNNAQGEYYLTSLLHLAREQGKTIEAVPLVDMIEALQPNTKEELEVLEGLLE